jgi:lysophospholipase L1-like esterase
MSFFTRLPAFSLVSLLVAGASSCSQAAGADAPPPAAPPQARPGGEFLARFKPAPLPNAAGLLLQPGDRLAICGDSITEQKMYSRILETYLTVCVPELKVTVRQYGWSGETAPGFLARMTNDCLRFHPTVATTCYGMNDHGYRAYAAGIGQRYREASTAIVRAFKGAGARVVLGSPGCVGFKVPWSRGSSEDMNLNLCELRNIDIDIATHEEVRFADVFWPMLNVGLEAQQQYGTNYCIAGKDSVHPDWAGQVVMASAFLQGLGVDGTIGTLTVDLQTGQGTVSAGHEITGLGPGEWKVVSGRYPFCATGPLDKDNSIRSGMVLVNFNERFNRFMLVARNAGARSYKLTWGENSKTCSAEDLAKGVNLAGDFPVNPFSAAFEKVDKAVAAKQAYETRQIKTLFHGEEGRADSEMTATLTEKVRAPLAAAIASAFVPVTHTVRLEAQ